jgi:hypothetical protein
VVALVAVDDNELPKTRKADPGAEAVKYAALLCKEPKFWEYLEKRYNQEIDVHDEHDAASELRKILGVYSRSEIGSDKQALETFEQIAKDYREWAGIE